MSGFAVRQVVLDHLAGKAPIEDVVRTDSLFDYAELTAVAPTLRANDLHEIAAELECIVEHLPPSEIGWRQVLLVRDDDGHLVVTAKPASRPDESRTLVRCLPGGEGVMLKGGDSGATWWRRYVGRKLVRP